ncbi:competence/damage-inducible protein A [Fructilactobacillus vespulae]|uniref:competence/damage-inducible protein A n=1 Tax=Fructilactobacillus vespulae TaxID=1249630 RepID=UPI0039B4D1F9
MKAEIITVGTEILLGEIIDTSGPFVGKQLANLGIDVYYKDTVGDNFKRLDDAISLAEKRGDLIILTGGLGPTEDDITKQVLAKHLGLELVDDQVALTKINDFYAKSRTNRPGNELIMAQYVSGATVLPNDNGFAVGMFLKFNSKSYLVLPGPPSEMQPMFNKYGLPLLGKEIGQQSLIESRVLHFIGIGETNLEDQLKELISKQTNPTLATYVKQNEVTLRITANGKDQEEIKRLLDQEERQVQKIVGKYFYGYGEENSIEQVVVNLLKQNKLTITAAESLTSGMFQSKIGSVSGASEVFSGGFVTYAASTKEKLVAVAKETIQNSGVVSAATAAEMAAGALKALETDLAVSFTGVAGPSSLEGHPAGYFWIGMALPDGNVITQDFNFPKSRNDVRDYAVKMGFKMIYDYLENN